MHESLNKKEQPQTFLWHIRIITMAGKQCKIHDEDQWENKCYQNPMKHFSLYTDNKWMEILMTEASF